MRDSSIALSVTSFLVEETMGRGYHALYQGTTLVVP
jgi:hypothetical protein